MTGLQESATALSLENKLIVSSEHDVREGTYSGEATTLPTKNTQKELSGLAVNI